MRRKLNPLELALQALPQASQVVREAAGLARDAHDALDVIEELGDRFGLNLRLPQRREKKREEILLTRNPKTGVYSMNGDR